MAAAVFRPPIFHPLPKPAPARRAMTTASYSAAPATVDCASTSQRWRKLPVLLFDVMDTLVRDPFYNDVPAFFQMSMKELLAQKHPTAWVEFEKGLIDENELARKFFKDGRPLDLEDLGDNSVCTPSFSLEFPDHISAHHWAGSAFDDNRGLKRCMIRGYSYVDGIDALLQSLKHKNYEVHAFTNYPIWYMMIEEKLRLSKYLSWTFCSCLIGKRKPAADCYTEVLHHLGVEPSSCIFVDDRMTNVEAAKDAGMIGLHFRNADALKQDLISLGIEITISENA
ncbi:haloacid dehalogenase-like hydrolase [Musa troglodytarum]|uniref:Haloacid dehalogenase-like hydrolase n=1 Tax=Musa troglodytarum TaxID=320322 RepID=A0A9E7EGL2_9LILI|nr:haloacid dehalogenase-like hydrolase [Musa troglodytarum]